MWLQHTDDLGTRCVGRPDIPLRYVYETGCRRIRFGGGVFFVFFCLLESLYWESVLLQDSDRDDREKDCRARRIDDVDLRCTRFDDFVVLSAELLLLLESLEQDISRFEL